MRCSSSWGQKMLRMRLNEEEFRYWRSIVSMCGKMEIGVEARHKLSEGRENDGKIELLNL